MKTTSIPHFSAIWQRLQSDVFSCLNLLVLVIAVTGCSAEARESRLLERANGCFDSGDFDKLKATALDSKALNYLGKSLVAIKQMPEGKAVLRQALAASLQEPLAADAKQVLEQLQKQNK